MKYDKKQFLLYAVTDRTWLNNDTLFNKVEKAIKGGVSFIQLREKKLDDESFYNEASEIQKLCRIHNIPFVINDNVELAERINADGVHIGQNDMKLSHARAILGENKIIGVSVQTAEQAVIAEKEGADYLGAGAVFKTDSKPDAEDVSYETLKEICDAVNIPVVAIGGINTENVLKLKGSGISGIAVISALFSAEDIENSAKKLKEQTKKVVSQ